MGSKSKWIGLIILLAVIGAAAVYLLLGGGPQPEPTVLRGYVGGEKIGLLEDPEVFQANYQVLRRLDGSLPEETDRDYKSCYVAWSDCPVLQDLPLGEYTEKILDQEIQGDSQELLSSLWVARRGFWTERTCSDAQECDALWDAITRGSDQ